MTRDLTHYVGIPYLDRGRNPDTGLDCWGLMRWFYANEFCIVLPGYDDEPSGIDPGVAQVVRNEVAQAWERVDEPKFGDAVVVTVARRPFHVGVYVGAQKMLHTMGAAGSVIESLATPKWASRIEGYYRHV